MVDDDYWNFPTRITGRDTHGLPYGAAGTFRVRKVQTPERHWKIELTFEEGHGLLGCPTQFDCPGRDAVEATQVAEQQIKACIHRPNIATDFRSVMN